MDIYPDPLPFMLFCYQLGSSIHKWERNIPDDCYPDSPQYNPFLPTPDYPKVRYSENHNPDKKRNSFPDKQRPAHPYSDTSFLWRNRKSYDHALFLTHDHCFLNIFPTAKSFPSRVRNSSANSSGYFRTLRYHSPFSPE